MRKAAKAAMIAEHKRARARMVAAGIEPPAPRPAIDAAAEVAKLRNSLHDLTEWERGFVRSITRLVEAGRQLSRAQAGVLMRLSRATRAAEVAAPIDCG